MSLVFIIVFQRLTALFHHLDFLRGASSRQKRSLKKIVTLTVVDFGQVLDQYLLPVVALIHLLNKPILFNACLLIVKLMHSTDQLEYVETLVNNALRPHWAVGTEEVSFMLNHNIWGFMELVFHT